MYSKKTKAIHFAQDLVDFIDASPTPFHVVKKAKELLEKAGFTELREDKIWPKMQGGDKHYVTRNDSSIIAFTIGGHFPFINIDTGFKIIGAHTDSPTLHLKPNAPYPQSGYGMLGIEPYRRSNSTKLV